jgi:hypothetical protein
MTTPVYYRRKGEGAKAFTAFQLYRDMGPQRSLARVGQQLGKSTTLMERWSRRWDWVPRAAAWDEEQDRRAQESQLKAIAEMKERHAKIGGVLQTKALEGLTTLAPGHLKPTALLSFLIQGVKMENKARGLPSEITEQQKTSDREDSSVVWNAAKQDDVRKLLANISRRSAVPPTSTTAPRTDPPADGRAPDANGDLPHP